MEVAEDGRPIWATAQKSGPDYARTMRILCAKYARDAPEQIRKPGGWDGGDKKKEDVLEHGTILLDCAYSIMYSWLIIILYTSH